MKKFLLTSTAVAITLGLTAFAAPEAQAKSDGKRPVLRISGSAIPTAYFFENSKPKGEKGGGAHFSVNDGSIKFNVLGRADSFGQFYYDWLVGLSPSTNGSGVYENRIRLRGEWGSFLFGNTNGVESTMARGAFEIMGGAGGFDNSNLSSVLNKATGAVLGTDMVGATGKATKATYITPRVWGVQAGVSYAPNSNHKSDNKVKNKTDVNYDNINATDEASPFATNVWSGGLNFEHAFESGFKMALSATGIVGRAHAAAGNGKFNRAIAEHNTAYGVHLLAQRNDIRSFALGGTMEYRGFEAGVEYVNNGKSLQFKDLADLSGLALLNANADTAFVGPSGGFSAGDMTSFSIAYTFGPDRVSGGYYRSDRKFNGSKTRTNIWSIAYDRNFAPGLGVFFGLDTISMRAHESAIAWQGAVAAGSVEAGNLAVGNVLRGDNRAAQTASSPRRANNAHAVTTGFKVQF